jgi:hypothetical protein
MSPNSMPDALTPLLVICVISVPLGLWKLVEIGLWLAAHIRWVSP